jgi:restriction system protein
MTIVEAIKEAMKSAGRPLTAKEAYNFIVDKNLYTFKAANPQSIVASQIRKHCRGVNLPKITSAKHFEETSKGYFKALENAANA